MFNFFSNVKNSFSIAYEAPSSFAKTVLLNGSYEIAKTVAITAAKAVIHAARGANDLVSDVAGMVTNLFERSNEEGDVIIKANAKKEESPKDENNQDLLTQAKEFANETWDQKDGTYFGQASQKLEGFFVTKAVLDTVSAVQMVCQDIVSGVWSIPVREILEDARDAAYKASCDATSTEYTGDDAEDAPLAIAHVQQNNVLALGFQDDALALGFEMLALGHDANYDNVEAVD